MKDLEGIVIKNKSNHITLNARENALSFYPPLTTAVTSSHTVTYTNVPIKVYMDTDQIKFVTQTDGSYKYEITLNEEI